MSGPSIPHRLFSDPWPMGHTWRVMLTVNSNGYITTVETQHMLFRPGGKSTRSPVVAFQIGPFDEVIDLVRESLIASAVADGEQQQTPL